MYMNGSDVENYDEVQCDCGFRHSMWSRCPEGEPCLGCRREPVGDGVEARQQHICDSCHRTGIGRAYDVAEGVDGEQDEVMP